ncbi:hypothetical protein [Paenibacillus sp. FSL H8-0537]|uniref:hypothetical protein n=1 Tax=Paenibacillus sp. FSL H8-0537 TaxID=2921399 RepID=UPI0031012DE5
MTEPSVESTPTAAPATETSNVEESPTGVEDAGASAVPTPIPTPIPTPSST